MFDFSAFTYRFYSQTVPVLSFSNVPDIVMRRRSICRRRTKSIVVFVFVFIFSIKHYNCKLRLASPNPPTATATRSRPTLNLSHSL